MPAASMVRVTVKRSDGQPGHPFVVTNTAELLDSVGRSCHFLPGGTLEIDDAVVGSTYTLQDGMEFIWYPPAQGE